MKMLTRPVIRELFNPKTKGWPPDAPQWRATRAICQATWRPESLGLALSVNGRNRREGSDQGEEGDAQNSNERTENAELGMDGLGE